MGKKLVLQGVDFSIEIPTVLPTITLAISNNNITANTTIALTANVVQGDFSIANVKFYFDGVLIEQINTAPYTTTKAVTSSSNGSKVFYAVATDSNGNKSIRNLNSDKTITVTIPVVSLDPATEVYLEASGITDGVIIDNLDTFVKALKTEGLWSKISNAYPILGVNNQQVKYNLKTGLDPLLRYDSTPMPNEINKGIKMVSVDKLQQNVVRVPLDATFVASVAGNTMSGHAMYFLNEDLVANGATPAGMALPISGINSVGARISNYFDLTGSYLGSPHKSLFLTRGISYFNSPSFRVKGVFGAVKNNTTVSLYGNGALITTGENSGTLNATDGNIAIGCLGLPIDNTVSYVSFGNVAMSGAEMAIYQNLVKTLIKNVHGITV